MIMKTYRIQDYKAAKETLKKYMTNKKDYAFIHYACQSFYEAQQDISPRIAAICVMYAKSKQIHLFSLASLAERKNIDLTCCDEKELDACCRIVRSRRYRPGKRSGDEAMLFRHDGTLQRAIHAAVDRGSLCAVHAHG